MNCSNESEKALASARRFIGYRPRSIKEVRESLKEKGFSTVVVEEIISSLIEEGLLDDEAFAKMWIEERSNHKNLGKTRVKSELRSKGVASEIIESLMETGYTEEEEITRAGSLLNKKFRNRLNEIDTEKQVSFLSRNGFSYSIAKKAIDSLK
jgi:regulatory protein